MPNKKQIYPRLLHLPSDTTSSIFLFGPRGTGKTLWLKTHYPDALFINLLATETYNELVASPSRLEKYIPLNFRHWIIIDEIQKIPELLNEVHRLIESKGYQFILTGSSARSLRRKGINLLAGRALDYRMHPLTATELGQHFSLERALLHGTLPDAYQAEDPVRYLETYVTTYLREEVLQEGITRNIGAFSRFLETASFSQGEVINFSEIAREAHMSRHIVSGYFDIVEDLLIGLRLPVFSKRAKRRLIAHPKFYFFDTGVYRAIRPKGPLDALSDIDGAALETLFLAHLRAVNDYAHLGYQFYFWRTSNQMEVDFVAYGEKGLYAFEIKRKKVITPKDLRGLQAFNRDYPMAKLYLLHGGKHHEYHDSIQVIPFEDGLFHLYDILSQ